jgi:hypothetical protein
MQSVIYESAEGKWNLHQTIRVLCNYPLLF